MDERKQLIITAIQDLIISRNNIFDNIVNIAFNGELSHLADAVDVGEKYEFKMNHFADLEDPVIKDLISICRKIERIIPIMIDTNDIDITELDFDV